MKTAMQPTRTQYKGIVFDSKSEAVFARTLDLAGNEWIYHPLAHCGHEWDFLAFRSDVVYENPVRATLGDNCSGGTFKDYSSKTIQRQVFGLRRDPVLIEYKPTIPTMTYVENLIKKMRSNPFNSVIVWGNPWSGIPENGLDRHCSYQVYPIFCNDNSFGWGDFNPMSDSGRNEPVSCRHNASDQFDITEKIVKEALSFRFDLA